MAKPRKRRKWSDEEKRMIVAQSRLPGISVSQVARRYDVNANQVFNWRKDPKFTCEPDEEGDSGRFLPVEIIEPTCPDRGFSAEHSEMTVELVGGHRLKIIGAYDPQALVALIRGLSM